MLSGDAPVWLVFWGQMISISPSHRQHPGCGHVSPTQAHISLTLRGAKNPCQSCMVQMVTLSVHLAVLAEVTQPAFPFFFSPRPPPFLVFNKSYLLAILWDFSQFFFICVFPFLFEHITLQLP